MKRKVPRRSGGRHARGQGLRSAILFVALAFSLFAIGTGLVLANGGRAAANPSNDHPANVLNDSAAEDESIPVTAGFDPNSGLDADGQGPCNAPPGELVDETGRPFGDMDGNCRTNLDDFIDFNDCFSNSGPEGGLSSGVCVRSDFNGDGNVDLLDVAKFQRAVTNRFVVFSDPATSFKSVNVNDVEGQIVRFDPYTNAIVWAETNTQYNAGFWPTTGNALGAFGSFTVRYGTLNGVRRAYFTETIPATICDIRIIGGNLYIYATNVHVP